MWLNVCGFNYGEVGKKGVYFDGHERDDVKTHRMQYIKRQRLKHQHYVRFDDAQLVILTIGCPIQNLTGILLVVLLGWKADQF